MSEHYGWDEALLAQAFALALRDPTFLPRNRRAVRPEYFKHPDLVTVVAVLHDHAERYRELPSIAVLKHDVRERFKGETKRRDRLLETIDAAVSTEITNAAWLRENALTFGRRRAFLRVIEQLPTFIESNDTRAAAQAFTEADSVGRGVEDLGQSFLGDMDVGAWFTETSSGVSTGFPPLDVALAGGMNPGELYCVAAPPGRGKTTFMLNLAMRALTAQRRVLYYTLEVAPRRVFQRLATMGLMLTPEQIQQDMPAAQEALRASMLRAAGGADLKVKQFPSGQAGVDDLRSHLQTLRDTQGWFPEVVFVDYADEMNYGGNGDNDWRLLGKLFTDLRGLAVEMAFPMWTASQFNRGGMKKGFADMDDIEGSFRKNATLDALIGVAATDAERQQGMARVNMLKLRERGEHVGKCFTVTVQPEYNLVMPTSHLQYSEHEKPESGAPAGVPGAVADL